MKEVNGDLASSHSDLVPSYLCAVQVDRRSSTFNVKTRRKSYFIYKFVMALEID